MTVEVTQGGGRSVAFITLGCAKNEVDSEKMRAKAKAAGYHIEQDPEKADAVVINTCSFIQSATEESLEAIFEAAGMENVASGDAKLIVAGCMPARYGDELEAELTEACAFVPCSKEDDIGEILNALFGGSPERDGADDDSDDEPSNVSAYVKISDGCDRFCSYCAIPYIRGRYHSFTLEDIDREVAAHVAKGAREIVLIAQDTGRWGQDFEEPSSLAALMDELAQRYPSTWFRVMYVQPEGITNELLKTIADRENICSYLDIPLQHVDKSLLRAMNRAGSREKYLALAERIRTAIPNVTLRTTLIAGFPGETEDQFEELCDFVSEGLFDYIGVFAYSREEGTTAYELPGQIDEDIKAERAQTLRDLADASCTPRIAQRVGQEMDVLVEGIEEDGQLFGRAMCQAPDVDGETYLTEGNVGDIVRVRIADTLLYEMEAE